MKIYWLLDVKIHVFLTLELVESQLHAVATLSPGKYPWYPLDMKLGGLQNRSGLCAEYF
jgi:hypothetical protein